ncbi:hypothetical protein AWQ21_09970 [Picosynechococcus sp. PCC 7003]|nr:transposase [Picosynechococcus sp. PCC 7003]ANV84682.1 hypothetical protein AWQ21_09970 [Picosynechococcus sp. PCC 7003]
MSALAAAKQKQQDAMMIAPMLVTGSVNAICFETWLSHWLMPQLKENSILVTDNAPIHRKSRIRELADQKGHIVKFLPKYSPDFNKIEHDCCSQEEKGIFAGGNQS